MATVGYATLDVIPSVRGLRAQLERQTSGDLAVAGRRAGQKYGTAAGATAAAGFKSSMKSGLADLSGGKILAGLGIAAAGKQIIGLQAEFESSINTLGASADLTSAQMAQMSKFAKQMGADTVFSAGEAADAMVELAKAGLSPANIQAGALKATMAVAATEGLQLADAATIISNSMTTFGIAGEDAVRVADALAGGSKASTASVASLAEAMSQVGGSAKDAGLSLEETVAALSAFDQEGIKGSDAGTSLKTMLSRLVPQTERASNAMADLGLNFTDAQGQFLPLADIAGQLQEAISGLSDEERTAALNTIFGSDARRAALALMKQGKRGIEGFTEATSEAGVAAKLANARMSGTAGAIERMKGSIETAGLAFGEVLAPAVVVTADGIGTLADAVAKIPAPVQAATLAFVAMKTASAFGMTNPATGAFGGLKKGLDDVRLRAMLAKDAFTQARAGSIQIEGAYGKLTPGVGRLSASMRGLQTATAGAGAAMKRGLGGAMNILGGPWGIALGVGVAALVKFKQNQQETKARVDELSAALNQQTGAVTKQAKEVAFKNLQDSGALDIARKFGVSLGDVAGAALGNENAMSKVNAQIQAFIDAQPKVVQGAGASATEYQNMLDSADKLRGALGGQNEELVKARSGLENQAEFMAASTETTKTAARETQNYADRIADARGEIDQLIAAEDRRAKAAIARRRDEIALKQALADARAEAAKGAKTLDTNTQAGRDNMGQLLDLADQWNNTKAKVQNARGAYSKMREEFIQIADKMGYTREQAEKLAEKVLEIPKKAPLKFQSEGFQARMREIAALKERLKNLGREIVYKPLAPQLDDAGIRRASGGPVFGAGTKTSDSIPAWLSNGEFVMRAKAVDHFGMDFMRRLNALQVPRFASGGPVQRTSSATPGLVIDQRGSVFQVHDYKDFQQQTQRRAERAGLSMVRADG